MGTDMFGNRYYKAKPRKGMTRERRWVIYKNKPEASQIPPLWHGWLHHQTNALPESMTQHKKAWQKPHQENMTGTENAWRPPGHELQGGKRPAATGDYQSWQPPQ